MIHFVQLIRIIQLLCIWRKIRRNSYHYSCNYNCNTSNDWFVFVNFVKYHLEATLRIQTIGWSWILHTLLLQKKKNRKFFFFLKVKLPVTFFWQNVTKKFFGRTLNWVFSSFQNWITSLEPAWQQDFGTRRLSTGCGSLLKSGLELELWSGELKTGGAVWKSELYLDQSFQLSTPQHWN